MESTQPINAQKTKRVRCHSARFLGLLGIFMAFWVLGYVYLEISAQPIRAIPVLVLWGLMVLGILFDTVRINKEGLGGLIVVAAGVAYYLFFVLTLIMGWTWEKGGEPVELFCSLPLFVAGLLFYLCGKRRKKLNP